MLHWLVSHLVKPGAAKAAPGFVSLVLLLSGCGKKREETAAALPEPAGKELAPVTRSVVTYERGRYYTPSASNAAGRSFTEVTEEERRRAEEVRKALSGAKSIDEIQRELAEARTLESAALLEVVSELMKNQDPMVRTLALTLIEGINAPELVNPLREAFADPSADVRIQAMEVAQHVMDPGLREPLLNLMEDEHMSVRQLALQAARNQGEDFAALAIARAATSEREDMAMAGLALIEASPAKKNLELVMRGLSHSSAKVREQAHEMLFLTTHQSFKTQAEAQNWWKVNQSAFDDDLVILQPEIILQPSGRASGG